MVDAGSDALGAFLGVLDSHTPNPDMDEPVGRMSSFQTLSLIHPQRHSFIRNVQCSYLSVP